MTSGTLVPFLWLFCLRSIPLLVPDLPHYCPIKLLGLCINDSLLLCSDSSLAYWCSHVISIMLHCFSLFALFVYLNISCPESFLFSLLHWAQVCSFVDYLNMLLNSEWGHQWYKVTTSKFIALCWIVLNILNDSSNDIKITTRILLWEFNVFVLSSFVFLKHWCNGCASQGEQPFEQFIVKLQGGYLHTWLRPYQSEWQSN